jgi:hypothetical protein
MPDLLDDTWSSRDLPLLVEIARRLEASFTGPPDEEDFWT